MTQHNQELTGTRSSKDGLVRTSLDNLIASDCARDDDDFLVVTSNSRLEVCKCADLDGGTTRATRGAELTHVLV